MNSQGKSVIVCAAVLYFQCFSFLTVFSILKIHGGEHFAVLYRGLIVLSLNLLDLHVFSF